MPFRTVQDDQSGRRLGHPQFSSAYTGTTVITVMLLTMTFCLYLRHLPQIIHAHGVPIAHFNVDDDDMQDSEYFQYVDLEEELRNMPMEYKNDPGIQAQVERTFNSTHHSLYNDLPPLPPLPDDEHAICTASIEFYWF